MLDATHTSGKKQSSVFAQIEKLLNMQDETLINVNKTEGFEAAKKYLERELYK